MSAVSRPPLRELQNAVWKLLVAPEGVGPGLADLEAKGELSRRDLQSWIGGAERLDAVGRLDVYANMYFYRLKDAISEDVPRLGRLLGEARFHNLLTDYLLAQPSRHWSLRYAAKGLGAFLRSHPLAEALPFLPDLAALEWTRADVFQREDATPLAPPDLAGVPVERWADLRFRPVPALELLIAEWDVDSIWERLGEGEGSAEPDAGDARKGTQHLLVFRRGFLPVHEVLAAGEAHSLDALRHGRTFGEICGTLAGDGPDVAAAAARASGYLAGWLSRGLLRSFSLSSYGAA